MKTRTIAFILVLCMAASLCFLGCSGSEPAADKPEKTAAEIYEDVLAVSGFGAMTPVPKRDYIEIYGIDANNLADYVWYASDNPSLNADEVLIFRLEKESYADVLITLLEKHITTRLRVAEDYSPEEAAKLSQVEVKKVSNSQGLWVYFCVGSEYAKMMDVLKTDIG